MSPQTKARFAHGIQEELEIHHASQLDVIRGRAGAAWGLIEHASPTDWLDEPTYNALTEGTRAVLGDDAFRAIFRRLGRRLVGSKLFQGTAESLIRIFGISPHPLLKGAPRARETLVRDSGQLVYTRVDATCAALLLTEFPPSTYSTGTTTLLLAGTWLGVVDAAGCEASANVELEDVALATGRARFVVRW